jgi:hypothetical protein
MASYHVDATLGNDGNAGTIGAPWKTIAKVVSSTGAQETTLSWTTARICGGMIMTFKGVSAGPTWTPKVIFIT